MGLQDDLQAQFGLTDCSYRANLSKDELFHAAIENDRGRIRAGGPDDEPKAYASKLGVDGPLFFYSDPSCTGRPVKDTFAVAHPSLDEKIWWKNDLQKFDPANFDALLRPRRGAPEREAFHALREGRLLRDRPELRRAVSLRR